MRIKLEQVVTMHHFRYIRMDLESRRTLASIPQIRATHKASAIKRR